MRLRLQPRVERGVVDVAGDVMIVADVVGDVMIGADVVVVMAVVVATGTKTRCRYDVSA